MAASSSASGPLPASERRTLLDVARRSVAHGVSHGAPLPVDVRQFSAALQPLRATFVTLHDGDGLRGCVGTLEAVRPLVEDVARNAFNAAFRDHRFAAVKAAELPGLTYHVSILQPPEAMDFNDERDLLRQIRPGIDGLVLHDCPWRGTFLPSVWDQLPEKEDFWRHLKRKAGLPEDYWSDTLRVYQYTTEEFTG
jgi:AmmeMemoRadiSam system protein A